MDGDLYMAILEDELQQTMEFYGKSVDDIIFQQGQWPQSHQQEGLKIV